MICLQYPDWVYVAAVLLVLFHSRTQDQARLPHLVFIAHHKAAEP